MPFLDKTFSGKCYLMTLSKYIDLDFIYPFWESYESIWSYKVILCLLYLVFHKNEAFNKLITHLCCVPNLRMNILLKILMLKVNDIYFSFFEVLH